MARSEVEAYSSSDEEEDEAADLGYSVFAYCVFGDVAQEADNDCSKGE